jgi:hypothetical protein
LFGNHSKHSYGRNPFDLKITVYRRVPHPTILKFSFWSAVTL